MNENLYKAISFGSNFGFKVHYFCLRKFFKFKEIAVCSPNIYKKKINVSKKFNKYGIALRNTYDFISISTPPKEQKKICNLILKKNLKIFFLILEKPLTENLKSTKKLIKSLNKKRIKYFVNFIFMNLKEFQEFRKIKNRNKIFEFNYIWNFQQAYFVNKRKTWKILDKEGGGLVNYYLIHVIYNLFFFFKKLEIKSVYFKKTNKITTECKVLAIADKIIKLKIQVNINSKKNMHYLNFNTKNYKYELKSKSKNWVKGFEIKRNNKSIYYSKKKIDRKVLSLQNYININNSSQRVMNNMFSAKAHKYCDKILKFKNKND